MLTLNYQDLQYKKPKPIRNKTKVDKKTKTLVREKYPLTRKDFSASSWIDYKDWIKNLKLKEKLASKPTKTKKKKKGKDTKVKVEKAAVKPTKKEQYQLELKDPRWAEKRLEIFKRDGFKCACCKQHKNNLVPHHLWYEEGRKAWEYPDSALITLCQDCHDGISKNPSHPLHQKYFKKK